MKMTTSLLTFSKPSQSPTLPSASSQLPSTSSQLASSSSQVASSSSRQLSQPTLSLFVQGSKELVNEILWTIHLCLKDAPDAEADEDSKLLKRIAPNDLSGFTLGRTKLAYTKVAIADWFWEEVVLKDLDCCFFTLMFDDTTNVQNRKELQLVLKYWSSVIGA